MCQKFVTMLKQEELSISDVSDADLDERVNFDLLTAYYRRYLPLVSSDFGRYRSSSIVFVLQQKRWSVAKYDEKAGPKLRDLVVKHNVPFELTKTNPPKRIKESQFWYGEFLNLKISSLKEKGTKSSIQYTTTFWRDHFNIPDTVSMPKEVRMNHPIGGYSFLDYAKDKQDSG